MAGSVALAVMVLGGCPEVGELTDAERTERVDAAIADAVREFTDEDYAAALAALDAADCIDPRPAHEFMRGSILKEQGDCEAAVPHFDAFIAADVPEADAQEAQALRGACLESAPPPKVVLDLDPPRPKPLCPPEPGPDRLGVGLSIGGGVLLAGGIGLVAGAHALKAGAPRRASLSAHDNALDTARALNPAGWAVLGAGAALLAGGVIRLVLVRARHRRSLPKYCR